MVQSPEGRLCALPLSAWYISQCSLCLCGKSVQINNIASHVVFLVFLFTKYLNFGKLKSVFRAVEKRKKAWIFCSMRSILRSLEIPHTGNKQRTSMPIHILCDWNTQHGRSTHHFPVFILLSFPGFKEWIWCIYVFQNTPSFLTMADAISHLQRQSYCFSLIPQNFVRCFLLIRDIFVSHEAAEDPSRAPVNQNR